MTLTKEKIAEAIQDVCGFTKKDGLSVVDKVLEIMKNTLVNGEDVLVSGFGKFCVKDKKKRTGRNPPTAEDLILEPRKVVTFKCSGALRDKINGSE